MAKTSGITLFTCDRCGKESYLASGAPEASDWRDVQRYTADGVETKRLLCSTCYTEYKKVAGKQDEAFNEFMKNGRRA